MRTVSIIDIGSTGFGANPGSPLASHAGAVIDLGEGVRMIGRLAVFEPAPELGPRARIPNVATGLPVFTEESK